MQSNIFYYSSSKEFIQRGQTVLEFCDLSVQCSPSGTRSPSMLGVDLFVCLVVPAPTSAGFLSCFVLLFVVFLFFIYIGTYGH